MPRRGKGRGVKRVPLAPLAALFSFLLLAAVLAACAAPAASPGSSAEESATAATPDPAAPSSIASLPSDSSLASAPSALADSVASAASAARAQHAVAFDFIYHLLTGNRDSVALLFEEEARPHVTQEIVDYFQGQFKWLYNFIGGDFEEFYSGRGAGDSSFFREYRMSNETNKRYPLILIHVVYPDSVTPVLIGAQVKSFLGGKEKRVTGDHTWTIDGRAIDIHSVIIVETGEGNLAAIQFYDEDTAEFTQESVARKAFPLIRETIARGYLDSARTLLEPGQTLKEEIGVVFIRKDPHMGLTHHKIAFSPAEYSAPDTAAPKPAAPKAKTKAKKK